MSTKYKPVVAGLLLILTTSTGSAQSFDLSWNTFDGGGAMFTTGGAFEISGSIAQPDAGSFAQPLAGGAFELVGGFWPVGGGVPACACPGDVDCDNDVDLSDLSTLLGHFGIPSGAARNDGDLDGDGDVDISDLALLLGSFGTTC